MPLWTVVLHQQEDHGPSHLAEATARGGGDDVVCHGVVRFGSGL